MNTAIGRKARSQVSFRKGPECARKISDRSSKMTRCLPPTSHHGAAGRVSAPGSVIEFLHHLNRLRSDDAARLRGRSPPLIKSRSMVPTLVSIALSPALLVAPPAFAQEVSHDPATVQDGAYGVEPSHTRVLFSISH